MQTLKIGHIRDDYSQQVVKLARHEVTLHDFRDILHGILKGGKLAFLLTLQADVNEYVTGQAGLLLTNERGVAVDHPGLLQGPDAPQAGRLREIDAICQVHIADAAIFLQFIEN